MQEQEIQHYYIDIDAILRILLGYKQSGILQSEILPKELSNKKKLHVQLRFTQGNIESCAIMDERGGVFATGEGALQKLRSLEAHDWTVIVQKQHELVAASASGVVAPVTTASSPLSTTGPMWSPLRKSAVRQWSPVGQPLSQEPVVEPQITQWSPTKNPLPAQWSPVSSFPGGQSALRAGSIPPTLIPRKVVQVEPQRLNQWKRSYRMLFVLIDGKRTVGDIKNILSMSQEKVEEVLHELQSMCVITFS